MDSEALVRRYARAMADNDFEALASLRHPDWHEDWPQSRERVPSHDVYRAIHEDFPGGMPRVDVQQVEGAEDHWVVTPGMTIQRIRGSGDVWIIEGTNTYGSGALYYFVHIVRLSDGRILHGTAYFAEPFEAPGWRAGLTVPMTAEG